jgi:hypothetical protein
MRAIEHVATHAEEHASHTSHRYLLCRIASGILRESKLPLLLIKIHLASPPSSGQRSLIEFHMHLGACACVSWQASSGASNS